MLLVQMQMCGQEHIMSCLNAAPAFACVNTCIMSVIYRLMSLPQFLVGSLVLSCCYLPGYFHGDQGSHYDAYWRRTFLFLSFTAFALALHSCDSAIAAAVAFPASSSLILAFKTTVSQLAFALVARLHRIAVSQLLTAVQLKSPSYSVHFSIADSRAACTS